jgi:HD superfamily phosphodiesterase
MSDHDLKPFIDWFKAYTAGYITGEQGLDSGILLKREHSLEVLAKARLILDSLGWDDDLRLNTEAAALLHDVGRFPQFARHGTFRDDLSGNHARLGVEVLSRNPLLADLPGRGRKLVLGCVFLHNKGQVPGGLPEDLEAATRLVRDADKLDIMRVIAKEVLRPGERDRTIVLNLTDSRELYSPDLLERIRHRLPIDYRRLKYVNDLVLAVCGWVHDMNYPAAFRLLLENGHLKELFSVLPAEAPITELRKDLMAQVRFHAGA